MDRRELGQSLSLNVEMIEQGRPNRKGTLISPSYITIHNTSNDHPGADAAAHSRFVRDKGYYLWNGEKLYVSWHYTVDDRRVIKHLPVNEHAIHAGPANRQSIAIEICMHAENDQAAANARATRLVAALMHDLGIPAGNVVPHKHWTGKNCPVLLLSGFEAFRDEAEDIRSSIETSPLETLGEDNLVTREEKDNFGVPDQIAESAEPDDHDSHEKIAESLSEFLENERS